MIYKEIFTSKDNYEIPLFINGHFSASKYNPLKEAENFSKDFNSTENFFVIGGIVGGFHIESVLKNNPECKIIAFEMSDEDLRFCRQIEKNRQLMANPNVIFTDFENLEASILANYIPCLYDNFVFLPLRAWQNENETSCIKEKIESVLKKISADFSVQSHFGKIWQRNILLNLKFLNKTNEISFKPDTSRTAAVIAAGPSLDESIFKLKDNRSNYFIISTDTSFQTLLKYKIYPDAVVSIDGQEVSGSHFYISDEQLEHLKDTLFIFDLCSPHSVIHFLARKQCRLFFVHTGHPLSVMASEKLYVPQIDSGSGTVTVSACDAARKFGFNEIELFGADFSYSSGKAYAKGNYLENKSNSVSTRLNNSEMFYSGIYFRAPLFKKTSDNRAVYTTEILSQYDSSLSDWVKNHNGTRNNQFIKFKDIPDSVLFNKNSFVQQIDFNNFLSYIKKLILESADCQKNKKDIYFTLPFFSWLKKNKNSNKLPLKDLLNLEHDILERYN